ncbi:MAG: hypothetical protein HY901_18815 [Deltaproteobacteria bacterium]|nr:hypothetical protein [Deltaproteobacteria bacterium]
MRHTVCLVLGAIAGCGHVPAEEVAARPELVPVEIRKVEGENAKVRASLEELRAQEHRDARELARLQRRIAVALSINRDLAAVADGGPPPIAKALEAAVHSQRPAPREDEWADALKRAEAVEPLVGALDSYHQTQAKTLLSACLSDRIEGSEKTVACPPLAGVPRAWLCDAPGPNRVLVRVEEDGLTSYALPLMPGPNPPPSARVVTSALWLLLDGGFLEALSFSRGGLSVEGLSGKVDGIGEVEVLSSEEPIALVGVMEGGKTVTYMLVANLINPRPQLWGLDSFHACSMLRHLGLLQHPSVRPRCQ